MDGLAADVTIRGISIMACIDHAAAAAAIDMELRPTAVLIFGNPRAGTPLMQAPQTVGIDLPLKPLVWQDEGGTTRLGYNDPRWLAQHHGVDAGLDTPSYIQFADGAWLTRPAMEWFWDAYLPEPAARNQPTATPLNAPHDHLAGPPEALVIVDENDVLRDEGEAYARKLSDAGVRVTSVRYNGTIHDFVMLNALADTPATRGAITQAVAALKGALG
jgi:uncharacterized protein (DUF302 family)